MNEYASIIVANTLQPSHYVRCQDNDIEALLALATTGQCAGILWESGDPMEVVAVLVESGVAEISILVIRDQPAIHFEPTSFPSRSRWCLALIVEAR